MYGTWGVDLAAFTPQRGDGREPDFGSGPIILYVGRLHPEKGLFDLLDAFALVKACTGAGPGWCWSAMGRRGARSNSVSRSTAGKTTCSTGTVKHRDLPPLFPGGERVCCTLHHHPEMGRASGHDQHPGDGVRRAGGIHPQWRVPRKIYRTVRWAYSYRSAILEAWADALLMLLHDPALRQCLGQGGRLYA